MAKTDSFRSKRSAPGQLDRLDRKLLGELVSDATQSYAELGRKVGLSAPAAHERIKRLKSSGVISGISALLDGKAIGKPLLVFVHVATRNWGHSRALEALSQLPEFEEMHSVTGDTSIILKVRVADSDALELLLRQIHALDSVVSTKTFVALSSYLDRPVSAGVTTDWPDPPLPAE